MHRYPASVGGLCCTRPEFLDHPAPTVTTTEVKGTRASSASGYRYNGGPDRASDAAFAATGVRRLSVRDVATLQGFPPDHIFLGNTTEQYRQAGNAVPPVVAQRIGETIIIQCLRR